MHIWDSFPPERKIDIENKKVTKCDFYNPSELPLGEHGLDGIRAHNLHFQVMLLSLPKLKLTISKIIKGLCV